VKTEKLGGVAGGEGECGDDVAGWLVSQFSHSHPSETPQPILMSYQIILLRLPRQLMCKIWLEPIRPLRICACVKKHVLCGFFLSRAARCRDHPQRLLGGLYRYAECSWTRCSTFDNMKVLISCAFGLKTLIHAPKIGVFKGDLTPLAGSNITVTTKMALMVAKLCRLSN